MQVHLKPTASVMAASRFQMQADQTNKQKLEKNAAEAQPPDVIGMVFNGLQMTMCLL